MSGSSTETNERTPARVPSGSLCPVCNYTLSTLALDDDGTTRCPECGERVVPTCATRRLSAWRTHRFCALFFAIPWGVVIPGSILFVLSQGDIQAISDNLGLIFLVWIGAFLCSIPLAAVVGARRARKRGEHHDTGLLIGVLLAYAIPIGLLNLGLMFFMHVVSLI